jgi:uncharacterized membrane protein SpoIIM required for sporulation
MISMFKSCIFGFVTFGVYSIRMFLINTFAVGIIIHSLILDRKSILALKLIPHGIIEFFVIALQVLFPMAIWIYLIGNLKKILQSELKIKDMFMQIIFYVIQTLLLSTNLLLIAAIIEHFISLIKL